ncbi:prophage tail fiber N-terminal domain-containing protein [Escherichia coli]|nr:prophage tail fiber N-terminal domain-containing protein [Escherichia coli]
MSVVISGALTDGAGIPMSGCHIILKSRVNTSEVVMRTVADVVTGNCGEYCFKAQTGKYCVYLKQDWRDEYCVGDIAVYDDSRPGTLNDFLIALDEGDLKPDVVKRFEEMVEEAARNAEAAVRSAAEAKKSASNASESAAQAATHATDAADSARTASTSAGEAALSAQSASSSAGTASIKATEASKSAAAAAASKSAAATSAGAAKTSETNAAASAKAAKTSETNAGTSEAAAAQSASAAEGSKTAAEVSAGAASTSAREAADSATAAGKSAESAASSASEATAKATEATEQATAARNAASAAKTSEANARTSETNAAASAEAAETSAKAAKTSETNARASETDAASSKTAAETSAREAASSASSASASKDEAGRQASAAAESAGAAASAADRAETAAERAEKSADEVDLKDATTTQKGIVQLSSATDSESELLAATPKAVKCAMDEVKTVTTALAGKQPLSDILTDVSNLKERADNLLYFNTDEKASLSPLSEKARSLLAQATPEGMRTELKLKAAATMAPQNDIYDCTEGRLALSGAFGFGRTFSHADSLTFNGMSDLTEWVQTVMPGRYAVRIADASRVMMGTREFNGIMDVMWSPFDNDETDVLRKSRTILCFNQYYDGEPGIHCIRSSFREGGWTVNSGPVVYDSYSLAYLLSKTAGDGPVSYFRYPDVGVPVLAVYRGTVAGDKEISIGLGDVVQGSQLGAVNITAAITSAGDGGYSSVPQASTTRYSFPGRYMALSGGRNSRGDHGCICLFVRIA